METKPIKPQLTSDGRIKILIADDDPPTRILLRAAIAQWGFEVVEAGDGEEAWKLLQENDPPKILILDWLMPKLDGIGLCARVRQESISLPYIILLTQVSGSTNENIALEAGANEFLPKPFNMAELRSRLFVGRRIVDNEVMLAKNKKEFHEIASLQASISNKLNDLLSKKETLKNNPQQLFEEIQAAYKEVDNLGGRIKQFEKK